MKYFETFALKLELFALKTSAKAIQLPNASLHTKLQNVETSGIKGCTFSVFFLNIHTIQRKTVWTVDNVTTCSNFPSKTILLERLHEKWYWRVGNIGFCSSFGRVEHGASINFAYPKYAQIAENSLKNLLNTSGDKLLSTRFSKKWTHRSEPCNF